MPADTFQLDRDHELKLIGIHNQDPDALYIQFSVGDRYFIYERLIRSKSECIQEQLFGTKEGYRHSLGDEDEQFLINRLRFMPKTKRVFSDYNF